MTLNYVCEILKVCVQTDVNKRKVNFEREVKKQSWMSEILQQGEGPEGTVVPSKKKKVKKRFLR